ncbi:PaaI family thioesterase [Candidatus Foliamicus sp.]
MQKNSVDLQDPANHCFVCGPSNPGGLQVRFRLEGIGADMVCRAEFTPGPTHVGYSNMLHGGILYSLLDDVMANWSFLQGMRVHTARCEVRYREAVPLGVELKLEGRLTRRRGRMLEMEARAFRNDTGALAAAAQARFMAAAASPQT